jgi:hypothetical protein
VFPEGPVSEEDQKLSRTLAEAFLRFAATGDPNNAEDEYWPKAFALGEIQVNQLAPQSFHVQIMGWPLGTGPAHVTTYDGIIRDNEQEVLIGEDEETLGYEMRAMPSRDSRLRNEV